MAKRNSKGRFLKGSGKTKGRKASTSRRKKSTRKRGTLSGALAIIRL